MECVLQERAPPCPRYSGTLRSNFSLSLSIVKEGFSFGKLRKNSEPITAVRQAISENSAAGWGLILDCQCYVGRARLQCTEAFFFALLKL
jgi:hypothetical protein